MTVEGDAYLHAARRILADIAEVEGAITDQGVPRGRIRVSASLTHGRIAIVPLLGEFSARFPHIVVDLSLTDHVVDILGGQADIAVRFGALADSPLTARKLGETGHVIVAAPDYLRRHGTPQTPEDLLKHNCLGFNFRRAEAGWPFRRDGRDFRLKVAGSIVANSGEALTHLARHGVGIAREGAFAVREDLANGSLIALLEDYNPQDREAFHAVFVGGPTMPARVRVFVDFLVEKFGAGPALT